MSVQFPSLPDPTTAKAETFDEWDARVNPATTQTTTHPTTQTTQPAL